MPEKPHTLTKTRTRKRVVHTAKEVVTGISVDRLPRLVESYLLAGDIAQHSKNTIDNRRALLAKLSWFFEKKGYATFNGDSLAAFLGHCSNGHEEPGGRFGNPKNTEKASAGTVATYHRHLKTFSNWLKAKGYVSVSPMDSLPSIVNRPDQVQPFTAEHVTALLKAAGKSRNSRRDLAALYLMLDTGVRVTEAATLKIGDLDLETNQLTVVYGKGGKSRVLAFERETKRCLYEYLQERGLSPLEPKDRREPLFVSGAGPGSGNAMTRYGFLQMYERLAEDAKVIGVRCSPHTMRHTFSIFFLRSGGSVFALKAMLGHESLAMVNRYVAIAQADIQREHMKHSPVAHLLERNGKRGRT